MQVLARDSEIPSYSPEELKNNIIVKLKNFRCYGDVELKIPINSVTLINGPSGSGKTTLFESFMFIMYDDVKKPERFETKTCWGWLFIGNLRVYRERKTNILKVWKSNQNGLGEPILYVGEEAQKVIDSIYGPKRIFLACSYLKQKEFSLFLGTSDKEKLEIIKNVGLKDGEFEKIKTPIKDKVTSLSEQYIAIKAQLDMAIKNVQQFDHTNPNIVQHQIPENPAEVLEKVKSIRTNIDALDRDYEEAIQRETNIKVFKNQVDLAKSKQDILKSDLDSIKIVELRDRLAQIEIALKEFTDSISKQDRDAKLDNFKKWVDARDANSAKLNSAMIEIESATDAVEQFLGSGSIRKATNKVETVSTFKTKLVEIGKNLNEASIMVTHLGCKSLDEAKVRLVEIEASLSKLKGEEQTVRSDLESLTRWQEVNEKSLKAKSEADQKKLAVEKSKIEEEKIKLQKEAAARRLATKMECPGCKILLRLGDDEKHLQKCENTSLGIGAMLGNIAAPEAPKDDPSKSPMPNRLPNIEPVLPIPIEADIVITPKPDIKVTHDDLIKITNSITSMTEKRDRYSSIIEICQLKLKNDFNLSKKDDVDLILTGLEKYQDLSLEIETINQTLAEHEKTKPAEVVDLKPNTGSRETLDKEKLEIQEKIARHSDISKNIEVEEIKIKSFTGMIVDIMAVPELSSLDVKKKKHALQGQIDQLMHLNSASDLAGQRSVLEKTMREKADQAKHIEKMKNAATRLMTKAQEAERISLQTAISEINSHLSKILKRLFTNVPISVELTANNDSSLNSTDSIFHSFDIKIFYNNSDYGSSNQLSGGEKDRVSLAITLALSEKFKSPILFLDETLSSLDPELKSEAVSMLKEYCKERTCVVISHDEAEGMYNNVIRIRGKQ